MPEAKAGMFAAPCSRADWAIAACEALLTMQARAAPMVERERRLCTGLSVFSAQRLLRKILANDNAATRVANKSA